MEMNSFQTKKMNFCRSETWIKMEEALLLSLSSPLLFPAWTRSGFVLVKGEFSSDSGSGSVFSTCSEANKDEDVS